MKDWVKQDADVSFGEKFVNLKSAPDTFNTFFLQASFTVADGVAEDDKRTSLQIPIKNVAPEKAQALVDREPFLLDTETNKEKLIRVDLFDYDKDELLPTFKALNEINPCFEVDEALSFLEEKALFRKRSEEEEQLREQINVLLEDVNVSIESILRLAEKTSVYCGQRIYLEIGKAFNVPGKQDYALDLFERLKETDDEQEVFYREAQGLIGDILFAKAMSCEKPTKDDPEKRMNLRKAFKGFLMADNMDMAKRSMEVYLGKKIEGFHHGAAKESMVDVFCNMLFDFADKSRQIASAGERQKVLNKEEGGSAILSSYKNHYKRQRQQDESDMVQNLELEKPAKAACKKC